MFTELLGQHFVHTALMAGAVVSVVAGAIGVFVVLRGASFAVHAISELGFTGAAGALVIGLDPVIGMIGGSLIVGAVLAVLFRPLLFSSVDPEVAAARGVPLRTLSVAVFLLLALMTAE